MPATGRAETTTDPQAASVNSPEELATRADLPLYPGATAPSGMSNVRTSGKTTRYEIILSSPDTAEKVYLFYKGKLKKAEHIGANLMGLTPKGYYASIKAVRGEDKTDITIVVSAEEAGASGG